MTTLYSNLNNLIWSQTMGQQDFMMVLLIISLAFCLLLLYIVSENGKHKVFQLNQENQDLEEELNDMMEENRMLKNYIIGFNGRG